MNVNIANLALSPNGNSFSELTANSTLSLNLQPIQLFLLIYYKVSGTSSYSQDMELCMTAIPHLSDTTLSISEMGIKIKKKTHINIFLLLHILEEKKLLFKVLFNVIVFFYCI